MGEQGRRRLGRGLDALISAEPRPGENVVEVGVDEIDPNPYQPRRDFDEEKLGELAASVREHGVVQPVIVRVAGGRYQLVAGERRWRAARMAGLASIPAVVRQMSDRQAMEVALVENLQRQDLNPMEEARAYHRLVTEMGWTQEEVARRVGKSRPAVANALRLLSLDEAVQSWVAEGRLTAGHARALAALPAGPTQREVARRVAEGGLNVRQTEILVRRAGRRAAGQRRAAAADTWGAALAQELQARLGTRVRVRRGRAGRGVIEIDFYGEAELERVCELIMGAPLHA